MCQLRCAALLCISLLLVPTARTARTAARTGARDDGAAAGEHEVDDASMMDAAGIEEATSIAMDLWSHTQVVGCLEYGPTLLDPAGWFHHQASKLNKAEHQKKTELVKKVWEQELHETRQSIVKNSMFSSIKDKISTLLRRERNMLAEVPGWKKILLDQYKFDYDKVKGNCVIDLTARVNRTRDMVEEELSSGCSGGCSKRSLFGKGECKEPSQKKFCPEGTKCGCSFERNEALGAAVGAMALATYTGLTMLVAGPAAGLAIPGKVEVGMLTAILSSSKAEGCRCIPSPCKWDKAREACAPAASAGAKNPFQTAMPYVGLKCAAKPSSWRSALDLDPGCEVVGPCAPDDHDKMGQIGADTFNCKYVDGTGKFTPPPSAMAITKKEVLEAIGFPLADAKTFEPTTLFPSMQERMQAYKKQQALRS